MDQWPEGGRRRAFASVVNYRETVYYVSHEVIDYLHLGKNVIAAELGNGFYNVPGGRYVKFVGSFGTLMLRALLRMEHEGETVSTVGTYRGWKSRLGPGVFSCIHGGEDYDARRELEGWNVSPFNHADWQDSGFDGEPGGSLRSQLAPPIKVIESIPAAMMHRPAYATVIYDFEKNFAGWPRLRVRGEPGAVVRLRTSEVLDDAGNLDTTSVMGPGYSGPGIQFSYTLRGEGEEEWHPQFTYSGFQYVEVSTEGNATVDSVEGDFVSASISRRGYFHCSNPLLNSIEKLVDNAVRSNMQAVLTDCPHREKLGWQEVGYLMAPSILARYDAHIFFRKIIRDAIGAQLRDGLVPSVCPEYTVFRGAMRDSPEWGSAIIILPWTLYRWSGDMRVLEESYAAMVAYARYLGSKTEDGILRHGLGDWYDIGPQPSGPSQLTPAGLTASAIYYHDLVTLADTARTLGNSVDAESYADQAEEIRRSFNRRFYNTQHHYYGTGSQTAQAMPLAFDIVPLLIVNRCLLNW